MDAAVEAASSLSPKLADAGSAATRLGAGAARSMSDAGAGMADLGNAAAKIGAGLGGASLNASQMGSELGLASQQAADAEAQLAETGAEAGKAGEQMSLIGAASFEGLLVKLDSMLGAMDKLDSAASLLSQNTAALTNAFNEGFSKMSQNAQNASDSVDDLGDSARDLGDFLREIALTSNKAETSVGEMTKRLVSDMAKCGSIFKNSDFLKNFGDDVTSVMRASIAESDKLGTTLKLGVSVAIAETSRKAASMRKNVVKSVQGMGSAIAKTGKGIGDAFSHPVQTLKSGLASAAAGALKSFVGMGAGANKAAKEVKVLSKDVEDLGDEAEDAGEKGKNAEDEAKEGAEGAESALSKLAGGVKGAAAAFLSFEAAKGVLSAVGNLVKGAAGAAMEAEKTAASFSAVFKGAAGEIEEWADMYANAASRSKTEVKGFLASSQAMYTSLGMGADSAKEMSQATAALAYDLGAAFKMDDAEALQALQSAIGGSADALSMMGVALDEATIKKTALAMGVKKEIKDLDDQALAQIRLQAILEQTTEAQGDALESMGGVAGGLKSAQGFFKNLMADIGAKLMPALEKGLGAVLSLLPKIEPLVMGLADSLANGLGGVADFLSGGIGGFADSFLGGVGGAIADIGSVAKSVLPALVEGFNAVNGIMRPFKEMFLSLAANVLPPLMKALKDFIGSAVKPIADAAGKLATGVLPALASSFQSLLNGAVLPLLPVLSDLIGRILPPLSELFESLATNVIPPLADAVSAIVSAALPPLMELFSVLTDDVLPPLIDAFNMVVSEAIMPLVPVVTELFAEVFPPLMQVFNKVVKEVLPPLLNIFSELVKKIMPPVVEHIKKLAAVFKPVIDIVLMAVEIALPPFLSILGSVGDMLGWVADKIAGLVGWVGKVVDALGGAAGKVAEFFSGFGGGSSAPSALAPAQELPRNAAGTLSFPGGPTWINEAGGEIAVLPKGTAVMPAGLSSRVVDAIQGEGVKLPKYEPAQIPAGGRGGAAGGPPVQGSERRLVSLSNTFHITIQGGMDGQAVKALEERLRQAVRDEIDALDNIEYNEDFVQSAVGL
jgi:phage-related protein